MTLIATVSNYGGNINQTIKNTKLYDIHEILLLLLIVVRQLHGASLLQVCLLLLLLLLLYGYLYFLADNPHGVKMQIDCVLHTFLRVVVWLQLYAVAAMHCERDREREGDSTRERKRARVCV